MAIRDDLHVQLSPMQVQLLHDDIWSYQPVESREAEHAERLEADRIMTCIVMILFCLIRDLQSSPFSSFPREEVHCLLKEKVITGTESLTHRKFCLRWLAPVELLISKLPWNSIPGGKEISLLSIFVSFCLRDRYWNRKRQLSGSHRSKVTSDLLLKSVPVSGLSHVEIIWYM